jgi:hypothetical protein
MKIIEGWTSKQEVRAGVWYSLGEEKVYQFAMHVFESKKLAEKVYGSTGIRKVRVRLQEIKENS